ncbi:MAG: alpha/beta hydrolase [Bryobacteraceae bacterium]
MKNRKTMIRGMFGKSATPALQEHILKMMLAAPETTAYQAMAATFAGGNWTEETIAVPALGIYADHSAANDPGYFKKIFPNGSTVEVPSTGHFVMMEKPAEFNKLPWQTSFPKPTSKRHRETSTVSPAVYCVRMGGPSLVNDIGKYRNVFPL